MKQIIFVGLALIAVSAFHLIPAVRSGEIPSRWPVNPLTREAKPIQFRIAFGVFLAAGLAGLLIVMVAALKG